MIVNEKTQVLRQKDFQISSQAKIQLYTIF